MGSMTIPAAVFARLWIIGRECRLGLPVSPWMLWVLSDDVNLQGVEIRCSC